MNSGKKKANLTKLYTLSENWVSKPKMTKTIGVKHDDWSIRLKVIRSESEIIKISLQSRDRDLASLNVGFKELDKKFKTLCKEVMKLQKIFAKKREEINTKLLFVIDTVDSSNKILFDATKENCKKILECLDVSRVRLSSIAKIVEECEAELRGLEQRLSKLLLPINVETCADIGKDLKEKLEEIHRTAASMTVEEAPATVAVGAAAGASGATSASGSGPAGIQRNLTLLRDSCSAGLRLIDLVNANVTRVFKTDALGGGGAAASPATPVNPASPVSPAAPISPASPTSPIEPASPASPMSPASPGALVSVATPAGVASPIGLASPVSVAPAEESKREIRIAA